MRICGAFALFLASLAACAAEVRIGVLAWMGEEAAVTQWSPLAASLERSLPAHRFSLRYFDLDGMARALADREVDFVATNPGHYVVLEARHGVTRIATQTMAAGQDPAHTVGSAVLVLAGRDDLRTLEDLRGRRLAAVAPEAFGGYQVVWAELKRRGIDPEAGDVVPRFTGFPMSRVIAAVESGEADAGAVRSCLLEQLVRDGAVPKDRFRVLSPQGSAAPCQTSSRSYPGWAFAATSNTPLELAREVLIALLSLAPDQGAGRWSVPADYHPVHEMLRELHLAPYDFLREHTLESQVRRYWPYAAGMLVVLLLWLAYTLRVEVLVQRRTRELSAALSTREQLEESVRAQRQQMEHLSRLSVLGELSGTLAHELNQPLAAIGNYARSLTRRLARGNLSEAAVGQAADEIASESDRAAGILAGIRDFARKRTRVREARTAAELVDEAVRLFRGMVARAPAVEIRNGLDAAAGTVEADPLQIQQVLLNLLKNALDAQRSVGRGEQPIVVSLFADGERIGIGVRDRGPGLSDELRAHLFEPFFTTKPEGMGLGLSICKTIIESHGGELTAVAPDDEGGGLCVRFSLSPATPATQSGASADASHAQG